MSTDRLYELLPQIYRQRDAELDPKGLPLRELLRVVEREATAIEEDIEGLYDNWFIETCADWVVPYIGELLGVRPLIPTPSAGVSARPYVANTLFYRRRKGTPSVLEQLARDVTGWPARVVEYFQLLATTQYINHLRLFNHRTPDLRDTNSLELLGGPFETAAHTVDVRRIAPRLGKYNIPNIGVFVWRLQSYPLEQADARAATAPGGFTFHPVGLTAPLFNRPQTEEVEAAAVVAEIDVPARPRRLPLYFELRERRKARASNLPVETAYFGARGVLEIFLGNSALPLDPEDIGICNLEDWRRPGTGLTVAVDPVLGRLTVATSVATTDVRVSYSYGFSGDVGGGPYNRSDSVAGALSEPVTWQRGVSRDVPAVAGEIVNTLAEAIADWNALIASNVPNPGTIGVISILDSRTYPTDGSAITLREGSQLLIVGADWPFSQRPDDLPAARLPGQLAPQGMRPHLMGDLEVEGGTGGVLVLNGLLVEGAIRVRDGDLEALRLSHSTVAPGFGGVSVMGGNRRLELSLDRAICGVVTLASAVPGFTATDSIVDAAGLGGGVAVDAPFSPVNFERCTVFGESKVRRMDAFNGIFTGLVRVERRQEGCIRFCNLPAGSRTPRQFRCVTLLKAGFTSKTYGDPGYAQLSASTSDLIKAGAEDGSEMGVFSYLQQPQRKANLQSSLEQYLRVSLEAGIYYAT